MKNKRSRTDVRRYFGVTFRDAGIAVLSLLGAGVLSALLRDAGGGTNYVSMLFILAVFITARFTTGYMCGILASLTGVLAVNFIFTYPYFKFNFTLAGYPLTMLCMLAVSLITSAMTTRIKESEEIKLTAEKEKMRANLLRAVSHDLRTPLTSILGALTAVLENDGALSPEARTGLLTGAKSDAQWLIRMVENLLAVTRVDARSQAKLVRTPEPAEEIAAGAIAKFKKNFPDLAVRVRVPDELLMVSADAMLIEQVLLNLMENAALHGKGADRVELTVTRQGDKAVFEVRDNGCGIEPSRLAHLFDGRLPGTPESGADGKRNMGIGLSVCSAIVAAHGGEICGGNAPEGGAVFRFTLETAEECDG